MKNLGILWLVYGILRLAGAAAIVIWGSTLVLMFGALLTRVPNPMALMTLFHIAMGFAVVWSVIAGIVSLIAGFALMTGGDAAKPLALLASFFGLTNGPLGVALGAFTLYFISVRGADRFNFPSTAPVTR
ncbi:MAG: hypothetical protein WA823_13220 [Candidatus Acidiferrales bacterium]